MVVDVVADTNFVANSRASIEALKSANLLKNLNLSVVIVGEDGVGKTTLARTIVQAKMLDCAKLSEVINALGLNQALILTNFHKITNYEVLKNALTSNPTRIIATADESLSTEIIDSFFSLKMALPPLCQREEDVSFLAKKFFDEANLFFSNHNTSLNIENIKLDVSKNANSLRYSIYKSIIVNEFTEDDILNILEDFLEKKIGSGDDYKNLLYLFDVPLIRAGYKKFNSQLAMAKKFGINRNTLRKKVYEYESFL